jgi:DNA repair photolyase
MVLNKAKGRMFKSVGWTWNPVQGCDHGCTWCWAKSLKSRYSQSFEPKLVEKYLRDRFPHDDSWIFVCSTGDLFSYGVKDEWIKAVLEKINSDGEGNRFLLQTKNPTRILDFFYLMDKKRYVFGTTLESTSDTGTTKAPPLEMRAHTMMNFKEMGYTTFLSLEPLADFDIETMLHWISVIKPEAIEIGLENYTHILTPPTGLKVKVFRDELDKMGVNYILKDNLDWLNSI